MAGIDVSICIATWNKAGLLSQALKSIREQKTKLNYEVVVVDDGSCDGTKGVCQDFDVVYRYLDRPYLCGSAAARNMACDIAKGRILIMQSDDVVHMSPSYSLRACKWLRDNKVGGVISCENLKSSIDKLYEVPDKSAHFAPVLNVAYNRANPEGSKTLRWYVNWWKRTYPRFFLGSMSKDDFWAVGGNDEDFTKPGYEDTYLGALISGVYDVHYRDDIIGFHQNHKKRVGGFLDMRKLYEKKALSIDSKVESLRKEIYGED